MRLKPGQMLTYHDPLYNKEWRVIKIADHPDWVEYCRCYALESRSDWWRGGPH